MSYRELRNFTESLRALGYPRLISIENFRTPNFKLVAEILAWLIKRYDPDNDLSLTLDSEQDRVIFIKSAALFLVSKARIKVNPKKLYQADGYAVQEMLKVTSVLYEAVKNQSSLVDDPADESSNLANVKGSINAKMNDLRLCRQLAAEIPERGASLFDLLNKEVDLREQRMAALARPLELNDVEKSIKSSVKAVDEETKETVNSLNNIASDEATLDAKIEKRKADLERQQKRLAQLQTVRPAYMDEYEKLENRLKDLYALYVLKFRNLSCLEINLNEFDRVEQEKSTEAEQSMRKMVERVREQERQRLNDAERLEAAAAFDMDDENVPAGDVKPGPKVYGNITGAGLSEEEEEEEEEDSLLSDDDEEDEQYNINEGNTHPAGNRQFDAKRRASVVVEERGEMGERSLVVETGDDPDMDMEGQPGEGVQQTPDVSDDDF